MDTDKNKEPDENIRLAEIIPSISKDDHDDNSSFEEGGEASKVLQDFKNLSSSLSSFIAPKRDPDKLLHHCLPITCLKLLDGIVLVASEGPSILIKMAYLEKHCFQRFQLFPSQFVVSGMEFLPYPALECGGDLTSWLKRPDKPYEHIYVGFVWAGSIGTLLRLTRSYNTGLQLLEFKGSKCANQLINFDFVPITAKWLESGNVLALLSVLNQVVIYERELETDATFLKEVKRIRCDKSETLFSGIISGCSRNDMRIFAGTVFNGICVWDVIKDDSSIIKHQLKTHDGIVFSLEYYADRQILLSTSDDRTVAAWQFSGSKNDEEVTLIRKFYGHDARVWKAISTHGYIISVSESSDVRVNILKNGDEHKSWRAHDGAPIFTCVYDDDVEILYTGGNEGSIRKWPKWWYRLKPRALPYDVIPTENRENINVRESGRWSENKDFPKSVVLLDINHVLVSMESGRVLGLTWEGKQFDLLYDERCKGFQIIKISPDQKMVAIAGNNGHFYTAQLSFTENDTTKCRILHAKKIFMTKLSWNIISLIWLDVSRILIICHNRAVALLLQNNEKQEKSEVHVIQTFDLNLQRPGVPAAVEVFGKYIIFGDELGSTHVLRYHKTNEEIKRLERVHKDGVTCLLFHDSILFSCGRDGTVKTFSFNINPENDLEVEMVQLGSYSMLFDWVTGIYVNMGHMLVCGFHKEDFIVHSYNEKRTLARIPCSGGGNKKWDFRYGHGEQGSTNASFTYVKDKEIFYTYLPMNGYLNNTLKEGLHSRTINCAVQLQFQKFDNHIGYITGSEDGSLKWMHWDVLNQSTTLIQNMENHVSSVRTVSSITTGSNRTFIFSAGGRSQLCVYNLDLENAGIDLLKEIVLVKTSCKQVQNDVRIMDTALVRGITSDDNELWCFSACSDGYVRVLYFNVKTLKFKIAGMLSGNAHAVMRVQILKTTYVENGVCICGVTSNGYLLIWRWDQNGSGSVGSHLPECIPIFSKLLRRTAFLSMKLANSHSFQPNIPCQLYSIICGGDDCSISLWSLALSCDNGTIHFSVCEKWTNSQIQRGSVVGVDTDDKTIYTLSNDQIIGFWSWSGNLKRKVFAGVTDCQGFVVDRSSMSIMCYGKGISWVPIVLETKI